MTNKTELDRLTDALAIVMKAGEVATAANEHLQRRIEVLSNRVDHLNGEVTQWRMRANAFQKQRDRALSGKSSAERDYILNGLTRSGKPKPTVQPPEESA